MTLSPFTVVNDCCWFAAAEYVTPPFVPPLCDAVIVHKPGPLDDTVFPEIVQAVFVARVTGRPLLVLALTERKKAKK
jgi:hypothetical protein